MKTVTTAQPTVKSPSADAEDRMLAARLARGEALAFDELVERYAARVTGLAARLLGWSDGADDVAQDVFLAVLDGRSRFRGDARLWTYLAAITVNRCRSVRRRRWLRDRVFRQIARPESNAAQPATQQEQRETAQNVRAAIARLPASYREVIVLRYFEQQSTREMAEVLGVRVNTVDARLSRARRALEQSLGHLADLL